tara:strand:+ start:157 stop:498 length:342 start_codon:yes stop_codon:yes gene_type:complete
MASYDHEAIYKAYAGTVVSIEDGVGPKDVNCNVVSIEQSKVDAARAELDAEAAKVKYRTDRTGGTGFTKTGTYYASYGDQLDMLYADMVAGKFDTTGTWATHIKAVKDANPKP